MTGEITVCYACQGPVRRIWKYILAEIMFSFVYKYQCVWLP